MSRQKIQKAIDMIPQLTNFGIGIYGYGKFKDSFYKNNKEFIKEQKSLLNSNEFEFEKVCKWLANVKKIKSINHRADSYHVKHLAEEHLGFYISNGLLIASAIYCGFMYKTYFGSPNVSFNISEKSLKPFRDARVHLQ